MTELIGKILIAKSPEKYNKIDSYITLSRGILVAYQIIIKGQFHCKDGRVFGEKGKYILALIASTCNIEFFDKMMKEQIIDFECMIWYDDIVDNDLKETPFGTKIKNAKYYVWPSSSFDKTREKLGYASDANLITEEEWDKFLKSLSHGDLNGTSSIPYEK